MDKPFDRVQPAFIGSALAVAFGLTLGVGSIPAAAAQTQAQAPCADPRGVAFCTQSPRRLVCCANPLPSPQIKVTPAAARPGETVVVEESMLPRVDGSASVLFEWWSPDGALADGDATLAPGSVGQLELVVPQATPEEGVLCVHRLGFQTACTAFTILPATTPEDPSPGNDPDNSAW